MNYNLSLTRRYVLYLAGIIAALLVATLTITSSVARSGFTDLFSQRMTKCSEQLEQYSQTQKLISLRKLEAVLTSPRFLAAVATGDSGTIHRESPTYRGILEADFMLIIDPAHHLVYSSKELSEDLINRMTIFSEKSPGGVYVDYLVIDSEVYEILKSEIVTNDGMDLGHLIAGSRFSGTVASQLRDLTGFDTFFSREGEIFGHTKSRLAQAITQENGFFEHNNLVQNTITKIEVAGEEIIYLSLPSSYANSTVTFVGSLDEYLSPVMKRIRFFLLSLSIIGGLAALLAIYTFTKRSIGRQVDALVLAAERIASGDMKFKIKPMSNDELGYLASEIEHMRSRLIASSIELEKEHEIRVASERLTATGKFAAGIIHDMKNPLAVIRASTELLELKVDDNPKVVKHCYDVNIQIDRLVNLTRDILEFCRGNIRLELKLVNLADHFKEITEFHMAGYKKSGVNLEISGNSDLNVNLDPNRFRRVVDNLLNNAREALKPGGRVRIDWVKNREKLEISISDNGPGIPESIRNSLFEPFVTSGKDNGTGLGLAVAKKIIEDHGARLSFESVSGLGTTFKIELPIQLVEESKKEMAAIS